MLPCMQAGTYANESPFAFLVALPAQSSHWYGMQKNGKYQRLKGGTKYEMHIRDHLSFVHPFIKGEISL